MEGITKHKKLRTTLKSYQFESDYDDQQSPQSAAENGHDKIAAI